MAPRELLALRQELVEMTPPPGRVRLITGDMSFGTRRVQDGFDPAAKPRGGFRRCLPYWVQHLQNGRCVHLIDGQVTQRLGIFRDASLPIAGDAFRFAIRRI